MKNFLFLLLFPVISFGQSVIPMNASGVYEYTAVTNVDGASAEKLYSNAKIFIVDAFRSGKRVTELNDDASTTAAGVGNIPIRFRGINPGGSFVTFKFFIACKDGRYKYTISNFEYTYPEMNGVSLEDEKALKHYATKGMREQIFTQVKSSMERFIMNMEKAMKGESKNTENW